MNTIKFFLLSLAVIFIYACNQSNPTPKPRGYFKINLPEKAYQKFNPEDCPFQFEIPTYTKIIRQKTFFNEPLEYPCWMNLKFEKPGGTIHLSYKPVANQDSLQKLIDDAHKLTFKHSVKADYIDEVKIDNQKDVQGIVYQIGGNAASNLQFYVTDQKDHYLRGALYFPVTPNEDSLAPVIDFIKGDIIHMLKTMEWKEVEKE